MILRFESLRLAREARDRVLCAPAPPLWCAESLVSRSRIIAFSIEISTFSTSCIVVVFTNLDRAHEPARALRRLPPVVSRKATY